MKTDARVRYTNRMIRQCFYELLLEKELSKITVSEICKHAQINRSTFYKHYADPYDLMEKLEDEAISGILRMIDACPQEGAHAALSAMFEAIRKNQSLHSPALLHKNSGFARRLALACFHKIQNDGALPASGNDGMCFACIAGAVSGLLSCWLHGGLKESPQKLADTVLGTVSAIGKSFSESA